MTTWLSQPSPHGHGDYLADDHLHHRRGGYCGDHGSVELA
jgi:hypothetical protein